MIGRPPDRADRGDRAPHGDLVGRVATTAAIAGVAAVAIGSVVAAVAYRGYRGEPYSPLNHWVSELGQLGVSEQADVFNLGVGIGGLAFVAFMVGLMLATDGRVRWLYGPIGAIAGIGGTCVGIFPMNYPDLHVAAASTFFNLGWIAVALASLRFVRDPDPRFPRRLAVLGAVTVACFVAFLVSLRVDDVARSRMASQGPIVGRPDVWIAPVLEWAVIAGILGWTLLTGLGWRGAIGAGRVASGAPRAWPGGRA